VGNLILLLPNLPPSKEKLESGISCEISGFLINNCSKKKKLDIGQTEVSAWSLLAGENT
jgi:hypothetical protein